MTSILEQATELTGDGHGHHIPGTPMVYKHGWIPVGAQAAAAAAPSVPWDTHGERVAYHDSLGIKREDMPQLSGSVNGQYQPSSVMVPKFLDQVRAEGASVTSENVAPESLKPTQRDGNTSAIRGIADALKSGDIAGTKPVVVSSEGRVLDGHHNWAGNLLANSETGKHSSMAVIRVGLPIRQLIDRARRFAGQQGIASRGSATVTTKPVDTLGMHTRDGRLTPEREALHQRIVDQHLAGKTPVDHPVATFLGGGTASGKSTVLAGEQPNNVVIDADAIKAMLPEYGQMLASGDKRAAALAHEESSLIAKKVKAAAEQGKLNYTLDGTGDSAFSKMLGKVQAAARHGYLTVGKYVTVPTDIAIERAKARAAKTGRMPPESVIRSIHSSVSDVFGQLMAGNHLDAAELWDTSGPKPTLVGSKALGGHWNVHQPHLYQQFLAKAKGHPGGSG